METERREEAKTLVAELASPDRAEAAAARLSPLVYEELREMASGLMRRERSDHTLQPTALVHEAFVRLGEHVQLHEDCRPRFFALAARCMRNVLVDHARRRAAKRRKAEGDRISFSELDGEETGVVDLLALDEAMTELAELDERLSRVIELRFFAGLGTNEIAQALAISATTVREDWYAARAWLRKRLAAD